MDYKRAKDLGIASIVLAIIGFLCFLLNDGSIVGVISSMFGIIIGIKSRKTFGKKSGKLALVGIIFCTIAFMLDSIVFTHMVRFRLYYWCYF